MAARKPKRRKPTKRKAKTGRGQIPLTVLKKRLAKPLRTVKERESKRQTSMF